MRKPTKTQLKQITRLQMSYERAFSRMVELNGKTDKRSIIAYKHALKRENSLNKRIAELKFKYMGIADVNPCGLASNKDCVSCTGYYTILPEKYRRTEIWIECEAGDYGSHRCIKRDTIVNEQKEDKWRNYKTHYRSH